MKKNRKCVQTIFFNVRGYFEILVFEVTRVNCIAFAVPGKVTDLNIEAKNLSLVVTWKRPEEPNGNIIQYQIDWSSVNINCTDCLNTSDSQTCPPVSENKTNIIRSLDKLEI